MDFALWLFWASQADPDLTWSPKQGLFFFCSVAGSEGPPILWVLQSTRWYMFLSPTESGRQGFFLFFNQKAVRNLFSPTCLEKKETKKKRDKTSDPLWDQHETVLLCDGLLICNDAKICRAQICVCRKPKSAFFSGFRLRVVRRQQGIVGQQPTFSAKPNTVPFCSYNGTWRRSDLRSKHKSPFFLLCCTSTSNQDPIQDDQIQNHRAPLETDLDQPISTAIQHLIRDQERRPPSIWALIPVCCA